MITKPHGAYLRHAIPPAGPAGILCGNPAEDRPAPSPRQAVHRTTAAPPVPALIVGDEKPVRPRHNPVKPDYIAGWPPADVFATHAAHRTAAERRERWRDRLHGAGIAVALVAAVAAAVALSHATTGPIRPHVASIEVAR